MNEVLVNTLSGGVAGLTIGWVDMPHLKIAFQKIKVFISSPIIRGLMGFLMQR
jgi:hypothetical protein